MRPAVPFEQDQVGEKVARVDDYTSKDKHEAVEQRSLNERHACFEKEQRRLKKIIVQSDTD